MLLRLRGVHPLSAAIAAAFVVWLILRSRRAGLTRWTSTLIALLSLQFALGIADVVLLAPTWLQILHLFGADLYWVTLVVLASAVVWPARGPALTWQPDNP
jgi:cytochrome c oxidase assembly protein subunit 15